MDKKQFCLFETATTPFPTGDYEWKFNTRNNLEGYDKVRGTFLLGNLMAVNLRSFVPCLVLLDNSVSRATFRHSD